MDDWSERMDKAADRLEAFLERRVLPPSDEAEIRAVIELLREGDDG